MKTTLYCYDKCLVAAHHKAEFPITAFLLATHPHIRISAELHSA